MFYARLTDMTMNHTVLNLLLGSALVCNLAACTTAATTATLPGTPEVAASCRESAATPERDCTPAPGPTSAK